MGLGTGHWLCKKNLCGGCWAPPRCRRGVQAAPREAWLGPTPWQSTSGIPRHPAHGQRLQPADRQGQALTSPGRSYVQWIKHLPAQPLHAGPTEEAGAWSCAPAWGPQTTTLGGFLLPISPRMKPVPRKWQAVRVERRTAHGEGSSLSLLC